MNIYFSYSERDRNPPSRLSLNHDDAKKIFKTNKNEYLSDVNKNEDNPIACILGGQPASGKSCLVNQIKKIHLNKDFFVVNGDEYRIFHPLAEQIIEDTDLYIKETQILSSYFTESFIEQSIKDRFSIIVEGTMRNPKVAINTSNNFKKNGFIVEIHAIAAAEIFTKLGIYIRYIEELDKQGFGRLADIESHNMACIGVKNSLDNLFSQRKTDKIYIHPYPFSTQEKLKVYTLDNNKWDDNTLPSKYIEESRERQRFDGELINNCILKGEEAILTLREISQGNNSNSYKKIEDDIRYILDEILNYCNESFLSL